MDAWIESVKLAANGLSERDRLDNQKVMAKAREYYMMMYNPPPQPSGREWTWAAEDAVADEPARERPAPERPAPERPAPERPASRGRSRDVRGR